jgi:hypothetical protein
MKSRTPARAIPTKEIEGQVLVACRRRCCLCVYLEHDDAVHKGQIAHLNHDPADSRFENLVWLCFNHHDEYDGRTSQSKGLTLHEVRTYRDRLYAKYQFEPAVIAGTARDAIEPHDESEIIERQYAEVRHSHGDLDYMARPWRFPLWQVGNRPELFAYKAGNRCDGVCLIERINLPDGRIVVAAIQIAGNPGNSITNCVEELCHQVCERFAIPAQRLVWLEHYDYTDDEEWDLVTFGQMPPAGPFAEPRWTVMDKKTWNDLRLRPKKRLRKEHSEYDSKVQKLFYWPYEVI